MNTSRHIAATGDIQISNLRLAELVARQKSKLLKIERYINSMLISIEYVFYILTFLLLYQWRDSSNFQLLVPTSWLQYSSSLRDYVLLLLFVLIVYTVILVDNGLFKFRSQSGYIDDLLKIGKAVFVSFMIAIGMLFVLKLSVVYSRLVISSFALSIFLIGAITRVIKLGIVMNLSKSNLLIRNVLIVGAGKVGVTVGDFLASNKSSGLRVVGFLDDFKNGSQIIGKINELEKVIQSQKINEIFITIPSEKGIVNQLLYNIRKYDVDIKIIPELFDFISSSIQFQKTVAYPYIEIVKTPLRGINLLGKRVIDIVLASICVIVLLPVMIVTAVSIKLDSSGPVFFRQKRIGKNGIPFYMYKFRSMVVNAEELKKKLEEQNEVDGPVFKIKNDPRITKLGAFIRKYSIDELPQLFNVLKGDMSLIGPRPPLPQEVEKYNDHQWRRLDVLPGITGLWQVSGRSDLSFDEWVSLDTFYIEHWSFGLDIKILLRTIPVVVKGNGAY